MKTLVLSLAFLASCIATGAAAEERMIHKEAIVKAPVHEVWNAWTTTEGVKTFFGPDARVEARPGGLFEIYLNPFAEPGMKGADDMHVLAVQPEQLLSFTWNAPPSMPEARKQRTAVIVRFAPVDGGTRVTLTHVGWGDGGEWDKAYAYFDKIWERVLANLQKRFTEGPVDWTEWLARLKAPPEAKK